MQDKVIAVSGGVTGIGAEVSARLAAEGARVVIADLDAARVGAKASAKAPTPASGARCARRKQRKHVRF